MIEQVADPIDPVGLGSLDTAFICYHGESLPFSGVRHGPDTVAEAALSF